MMIDDRWQTIEGRLCFWGGVVVGLMVVLMIAGLLIYLVGEH